jgi:hypothetical protein
VGLVALSGRDREKGCGLTCSGSLAGTYVDTSSVKLLPEDEVVNVLDKGWGWWLLTSAFCVGNALGVEKGLSDSGGGTKCSVDKRGRNRAGLDESMLI